ncbi:hypothetical protein [Pedobacter sp. MC2016-24]|uniref:hypothetical protein n=1 Tax=Pedobacter sp. MC2016-24 TaxID=2780090 RepID=UPI0018801361|nr:hypothetical protein [Pedobacter sp. MC2016-24]MBE9602645.1 hypothetical protein [Pedobacter sp. MC2016-24]
MPVFKNYTEDGRLMNEFSEPLNEKNIDRFISEYGQERAKMYISILAEFTNEIGNTVFHHMDANSRSPRSGYMIKKLTKHFYDDKMSIIEIGKKMLGDFGNKPSHP